MATTTKTVQNIIEATKEQLPGGVRHGYILKKIDVNLSHFKSIFSSDKNWEKHKDKDPNEALEERIALSMVFSSFRKPRELEGKLASGLFYLRIVANGLVGVSVYKVFMLDNSEIKFAMAQTGIGNKLDGVWAEFKTGLSNIFLKAKGIVKNMGDSFQGWTTDEKKNEELYRQGESEQEDESHNQYLIKVAVSEDNDGRPIIIDFIGKVSVDLVPIQASAQGRTTTGSLASTNLVPQGASTGLGYGSGGGGATGDLAVDKPAGAPDVSGTLEVPTAIPEDLPLGLNGQPSDFMPQSSLPLLPPDTAFGARPVENLFDGYQLWNDGTIRTARGDVTSV